MIVEEIKGDLLKTHIANIAHGVNCQNRMGSGVAKALYTKWPDVKKGYHDICSYNEVMDCLPNNLLGQVHSLITLDRVRIYNMFTQLYYGYDGRKYVDYDAIRDCFKLIIESGDIKEIAIPKIGCGLAGGDWEIVKRIINDVTSDKLDVYVYYLE